VSEADSAYALWLAIREPESAYGLWTLVIMNSVVFIIFAFSFAAPRSGRDWRSFGAFSAFLVALFTETGFLLQWPTLVTLVMFPILVTMYVRLARREERKAAAEFGDEYASYAKRTPAFLPRPGAMFARYYRS